MHGGAVMIYTPLGVVIYKAFALMIYTARGRDWRGVCDAICLYAVRSLLHLHTRLAVSRKRISHLRSKYFTYRKVDFTRRRRISPRKVQACAQT